MQTHAALPQGAQRRGDAGLGGGQELDADGGARSIDGLKVSRIVKPLDQGHGRDVERGQRLDRNLGIGDMRRRQDNAATRLVGVEQMIEAGHVKVLIKDSLG